MANEAGEFLPETIWVCNPRQRWYPKPHPGCVGRPSTHSDCGWFQLTRRDN